MAELVGRAALVGPLVGDLGARPDVADAVPARRLGRRAVRPRPESSARRDTDAAIDRARRSGTLGGHERHERRRRRRGGGDRRAVRRPPAAGHDRAGAASTRPPRSASPAPTVRWVATDDLERKGADELLAGADAVWCAPGSPYRSLDGALEGIRFAREQGVPFLGTCAGFQHAVIEVARNLAGIAEADHEEYGREGGDLVIHELLCSLAGQRLDVRIVDDELAAIYGAAQVEERYYCTLRAQPGLRAPARGGGSAGGRSRRGRRPAPGHAPRRPPVLRRSRCSCRRPRRAPVHRTRW